MNDYTGYAAKMEEDKHTPAGAATIFRLFHRATACNAAHVLPRPFCPSVKRPITPQWYRMSAKYRLKLYLAETVPHSSRTVSLRQMSFSFLTELPTLNPGARFSKNLRKNLGKT